MIDIFEKTTIQDKAFADVLGISESDLEQLSLFQMKNEMHSKAFKMRSNNVTITQEEADLLNNRLGEIICELEALETGYESMEDYIIDFNSFVIDNKHYNRFEW